MGLTPTAPPSHTLDYVVIDVCVFLSCLKTLSLDNLFFDHMSFEIIHLFFSMNLCCSFPMKTLVLIPLCLGPCILHIV